MMNSFLWNAGIIFRRSLTTERTSTDKFVQSIQNCAEKSDIRNGSTIHCHLLKQAIHIHEFIASNLLQMYTKCGSLENSHKVFEETGHHKSNLLWNSMMRAFSAFHQHNNVIDLHSQMLKSGSKPDHFTFSVLLSSCSELRLSILGRKIHQSVIKIGFESNVHLTNGIITMYIKCRLMKCARQVFDEMRVRDHVSWNALISGYSKNANPLQALQLFHQMMFEGIKHDESTILSVFPACAQLFALNEGMEIHARVLRHGFQSYSSMISNSLVAMYSRCGHLLYACRIFDSFDKNGMDIVSWNAMLVGFAQNSHFQEALELFKKMLVAGPNKPDIVSLMFSLRACLHIEFLREGIQLHSFAVREGLLSEELQSCLIDMYAKCGCIDSAIRVFRKIQCQDEVSWTVMISGCMENGMAQKALHFFSMMKHKADEVAIATILPACAQFSLLQRGMEIHGFIVRNALLGNSFVVSSLVDMYSKCGSLHDARLVFNQTHHNLRDTALWTAMIAGYAICGFGHEAIRAFKQMCKERVYPDSATFVTLLSACNHSGLVDEALESFSAMAEDFNVSPEVEHYACIVDLLGRAGRLSEAYEFVCHMPFEANAAIWGSLLVASRIHNDVSMATTVAEKMFELEPNDSGNYVLLSSVLAREGKWDKALQTRNRGKLRDKVKMPGCSWIEIKNCVYMFSVGD